jgi:hypothetical protein
MGAQALHPVFAGILADIQAQPEQIKRAGYIAALRCHDWTFEYSDDGTVYRAGLASLRRLQALQEEIDADGAIWNREAPEGFKVRGVVA